MDSISIADDYVGSTTPHEIEELTSNSDIEELTSTSTFTTEQREEIIAHYRQQTYDLNIITSLIIVVLVAKFMYFVLAKVFFSGV